jgi:Uma2 family endonuclease
MAEQVILLPKTSEQRIKMSYEEWLVAFDEDAHTEWVNGEAIVFMSPKDRHQHIIGFLHGLLLFFTSLLRLGEVRIAPLEMLIANGGPAREPDIFFIARDHRERLTQDRLNGPADLIIEVVSRESTARDRREKFKEYQAGGVREYLIVDSREGKNGMNWYALRENGRYEAILPDKAGRYHSSVLPGFWLRAEWLHEGQDPDPLMALAEICSLSPEAAQALRQMLGGV